MHCNCLVGGIDTELEFAVHGKGRFGKESDNGDTFFCLVQWGSGTHQVLFSCAAVLSNRCFAILRAPFGRSKTTTKKYACIVCWKGSRCVCHWLHAASTIHAGLTAPSSDYIRAQALTSPFLAWLYLCAGHSPRDLQRVLMGLLPVNISCCWFA